MYYPQYGDSNVKRIHIGNEFESIPNIAQSKEKRKTNNPKIEEKKKFTMKNAAK